MSLFRFRRGGRRVGILSVCVAVFAWAASSHAQEFRGSITGRVTDPSGATLPGVAVTATNSATNVSATTTTNDVGDYHLLYLTPGTYTVTAEINGFKKRSESNIEVRVGDKVELPMKLELGSQTETVEVVSEAPLLETATASAGQVIDEKRIQLMPLSDGNPFVLARLAPGVAYVDSLQFSRPFDNNATSGLRVDGGVGRNEFTLDGTPNTVNHGGNQELGRIAFVPPSDAVQEFKVETATFDAQQGHSGGTNVNVTVKSGTNRFFGTAYAFRRDEKWESDTFFNKKLGKEKAPKSYSRYGGTLGGPVQRDKTFFFIAYEGLQDEFPEPTTLSVPTMAQRSGDFSNLAAQGIDLYDPLSARLEGNVVVRDKFPGNRIPADRISQFGREIMSLFPEPNLPGDPDGRNNYFTSNPRKDDFYSITTRVDHNFSDKDKLFVRYAKNSREETRNYFFPEVKGFIPRGTGLRRMNDNAAADYVRTVSQASMLNVRVGWTRFHEVNFRPHEGFDPATLGFSSAALSQFGGAKYLPQVDLRDYQDIGDPLGADQYSDIYTMQATFTRVTGAHSLRMGLDLRSYRADVSDPRHQAGNYEFRPQYTSARQGAPDPRLGGDLVMLLLGIPTAGSIDRNTGRENETRYAGIFIQDDWRVSEKLTVNLGLRYDFESGMTETLNRNVRGFDLTSTNPLEPGAQAAYAANVASLVPELPASQFQVKGGYTFASDSARGIWESDKNNLQPRLGFTYKLDDKTVIRGGGGVYYAPFVISNVNQVGFSQATNVATTTNNGLTFLTRDASGMNPFSFGVDEPFGSSRGLLTNVGRSEEVRPVERKNARAVRFLLGFQRELPGGLMFEANYVGNRSSDIETEVNINSTPREFLSTSDLRDQAAIDRLETANIPNPFRNNPLLLQTDSLRTSANLSRSRLLRKYPHFDELTGRFYDGTTSYNALQLRLDKRFRGGFTIMGAYTLSKFTDKTTKLNPTDADYIERPHPDDSRHRITSSLIWELPFGKNATGAARTLLAGWNLTGMFTLQTGRPIGNLADRYYGGNLEDLKIDWDLDKFDPASGRVVGLFPTENFYLPDKPGDRNDTRIRRGGTNSQIRYFPQRLDGYRTQTRPILDASVVKDFALRGRTRLQLRVEVFNALNFVELNNPNFDPTQAAFASSNSQENLPRELQIGLKLAF